MKLCTISLALGSKVQSTLSYMGILCTFVTDGVCHFCADERREGHSFYGAAALIVRGHSQAKQRVILFLTIFIISGFCSELPFFFEWHLHATVTILCCTDLVLAMVLMIHLSVELINDEVSTLKKPLKTSLLAVALLQVYTTMDYSQPLQ